jgi:4-diphosphocytidyl-2-C-methyl-D-erythritol kinase
MSTRVRSFCKINLGLAIGPLRPDGFHGLTTLYQTLAAHDVVTVSVGEAAPVSRNLASGAQSGAPARHRIVITTNDERVPRDARNTVWKMLDRALGQAAGNPVAEIHVHIEKKLPVQGGLGAGSANAVAALIGLERELGMLLPGAERLRIAEEVGSDVPLFLVGGAVLGLGRGEEVYPMPDLPERHCVVALPRVGVSTPQAFREWDASQEQRLTAGAASGRLKELGRVYSACLSGAFSSGEGQLEDPLLALVRTGIQNDFEEVVFRQHPSLGQIKRILEPGAVYAALSGSGSAVFGLYQTEEAAAEAEKRLSSHGTASLRTKTLPRETYWETMLAEDK